MWATIVSASLAERVPTSAIASTLDETWRLTVARSWPGGTDGGRIPLSEHRAEIPQSLGDTVIGPASAKEINWVRPR
jgi:hypothetical protein